MRAQASAYVVIAGEAGRQRLLPQTCSTLTDSGVSWWLFCFLLAASWVASLVKRMLDPDPRDRSDGGGWWDSDGGGE